VLGIWRLSLHYVAETKNASGETYLTRFHYYCSGFESRSPAVVFCASGHGRQSRTGPPGFRDYTEELVTDAVTGIVRWLVQTRHMVGDAYIRGVLSFISSSNNSTTKKFF